VNGFVRLFLPIRLHDLDKVNLTFTILRMILGVINRDGVNDLLASFGFRCWRNVLLVVKWPVFTATVNGSDSYEVADMKFDEKLFISS
jgi:hypothetical protein